MWIFILLLGVGFLILGIYVVFFPKTLIRRAYDEEDIFVSEELYAIILKDAVKEKLRHQIFPFSEEFYKSILIDGFNEILKDAITDAAIKPDSSPTAEVDFVRTLLRGSLHEWYKNMQSEFRDKCQGWVQKEIDIFNRTLYSELYSEKFIDEVVERIRKKQL